MRYQLQTTDENATKGDDGIVVITQEVYVDVKQLLEQVSLCLADCHYTALVYRNYPLIILQLLLVLQHLCRCLAYVCQFFLIRQLEIPVMTKGW